MERRIRGLPRRTPDSARSQFATERALVVRHFETLAPMGEVTRDADGRYQADRKVA